MTDAWNGWRMVRRKDVHMLWRYIEQMLDLYKNVDGIVVVNCDGFIEYYVTHRPGSNHLTNEKVARKHVLDVWTNLTEESSTLLNVLRTGKPMLNVIQTNHTYMGDVIHSINSTMPITNQAGKLIGAVDVSIYLPSEKPPADLRLDVKKDFSHLGKPLFTLKDIITNSEEMLKIKEQIEKISVTGSSVLIYGETGSGKEMIAQSIHSSSLRAAKPFIGQNCAAIPLSLLESLLFGTTRGSYTGAENKKGLFEMADGGSLFLDEINSMEIGMQAKILRVLEERKVRRIGGDKEICFDVRLISAVNRPPAELLSGEFFRSDLYYRLSPVQIFLPPLRRRKEDIPLLAEHFIEMFNESMQRDVVGVSEEVLQFFCSYSWPGNVRELKNVVEGCFNIMSGRYIQMSDLPQYMLPETSFSFDDEDRPRQSLQEKVNCYEKQLIQDAVNHYRTLTRAARALSITKQGLRYKMEKYGIEFPVR